jgi:cytochrome c-type biogenesis protein
MNAPLAVAFTAGVIATLNPCGFAMLPAYLSWYLADDTPNHAAAPDDKHPRGGLPDRLARALTVGGTVSAGFLVIFGATGALVTVGIRSFTDYVSWAALAVGVLLVVLGLVLLTGRELTLGLPKARTGGGRRPAAMFGFGITYAVASLSCTLPVFLAVVASTFTRTGLAAGTLTFLAYGTGMSLVLMALTVALAAAKHGFVARIRTATRHVNRASGVLLVLAGGYMVAYWAGNLTAEPGDTTSGPVRFVDDLSSETSAWVQDLGWQPTAVALGAILTTAAFVAAHTARSQPPAVDDDLCCPPTTDGGDACCDTAADNASPGGESDTAGRGGLDIPVGSNPYGPIMNTHHDDPQTLIRSIDRDELAARLGEITPVEALSSTDFAQEHLPGAVNLPARRVDDLASQLLPDKHAPIAVYCTNATCRNSGFVAHKLADLGYTDVYHYPGGKQDWHHASLPTETGPATTPAVRSAKPDSSTANAAAPGSTTESYPPPSNRSAASSPPTEPRRHANTEEIAR